MGVGDGSDQREEEGQGYGGWHSDRCKERLR
jgi:hypothetical protein